MTRMSRVALEASVSVTYRAVESEREQHHEEEKRPERRARHGGDGLRVDDKHQARTCRHVRTPLAVQYVRVNVYTGDSNDMMTYRLWRRLQWECRSCPT